MNTFFPLALAATLSTAPNTNNDNRDPSKEPTTYVVTDKVAIWLTDAGKLKLAIGQNTRKATIEFQNQHKTLYTNTILLKKAVLQTLDLSQLPQGSYQIRVKADGWETVKTIQIEHSENHTFQLR